MNKRKICFVSQFPPPIHGLSKAVDSLYNSELAHKFDFEKIDITNNKIFVKNCINILKSDCDLFYFTISQSKCGNLRDLIILFLIMIRKKKCLVHLHGGYYRNLVDNELISWQKRLNYFMISRVSGVIVLSDSLKSIFKGMIDEEKIFVIPNCVDNEFIINDQEFNLKLDMIATEPVKQVLYLSNFIQSKGYPKVLELAKLEKENHLLTGNRTYHFNFAGKFFDKNEEYFFNQYIKKYHLEDYITYYGIVTGNEKRELLKKCCIFTLPTRYQNEGQPISILEAMVNGMLIITTNHAGIPDIVQDKVNGIIMKEDDIKILNDSLKNMPILDISKNNRNKALAKYSEEAYIDNFKLYFEII